MPEEKKDDLKKNKEVLKEKLTSKKEKDPKEKLNEFMDELIKVTKEAKKKFDKTDEKTKQKIIAGAAGAIGLIAGAIGIHHAKKHHKDK